MSSAFHAIGIEGRTRTFDEVSEGDRLDELAIPLTRTLIASTALASRDYQDVHHDPELAQRRGSKDIFMNILTTNGFVGRFVTDWAGPGAVLTDVNIRLGAPNYPKDTMTLTGSVTKKEDGLDTEGRGAIEVSLTGSNSLGDHVTGTVRVLLPAGAPGPERGRVMAGTGSSSHAFVGNTAVVGIGATEFSKQSGRSELRLAVEAVDAALSDAGIAPSEVEGMVTYTADTNPEINVAQSLGMGELTFFSRVHYGGGAGCGTIQQAALAVQAGVADVVVCYRAFNERSGNRFGAGVQNRPPVPNAEAAHFAWYAPQGLLTPAQWVAMAAQRYLHLTGATSEDLGRVAVADRRHAATNPKAWYYGKPITLEDHQASRWIVEPLHLLDCCQETDGGQALVVTSLERARSLRQPPAVIRAAAQGSGDGQEMMTSYYMEDLSGLAEMGVVARQLWETSGLTPADIQTAVLYDHFTPYVLSQLEELGFCAKGDAKDFVRDGNIELGGSLPINTHGGQLGEAYLHGHERDRRGGAPGAGHVGQPGGRGGARAGDLGDRGADQRAHTRGGPVAA